MHDITPKNTVNLLVDRLCRVKLRFDGHSFLLFRRLTRILYHFSVVVYTDHVSGCRYVCQGLPGPQTGYNPLATVDAEPCEGLGNRHHFNGINIHMRGERGHPPYRFGNVFWRERGGIFVSFTRFLIVAFETDAGKLGTANQTRFNVGHANRRAV